MHNLKAHADSQTAALRGNKSILIPGMSLLILEERSEVSRGIASYQYKTQPSMVETRGNSNLSVTFWPSELKAAGKMIWGWEPQIAFPFFLPSFSQSIFVREVNSRCLKWIIDDFSIFLSSSFFLLVFWLCLRQLYLPVGLQKCLQRQVWEEGRAWGGLVCTAYTA